MKVWITKYALTNGIIEASCERITDDGWCHAFWVGKRGYKFDSFMHPKHFETNKQDAISKANDMRQKKIESLKKQIRKLEDMKFE